MPNLISKLTPKNTLAEIHFLGACLLDGSIVAEYVGRLTPSHFWSAKNGQVWKAMVEAFNAGEGVDLITVAKRAKDEENASSYLAGLMQDSPGTHGAKDWCDEIVNTYTLRKIIAAAGKISSAAYEEKDSADALARAREVLQDIATMEEEDSLITPAKQAEILRDLVENKAQDDASVIPTGYPTLDSYIGGGLKRGELIIVAARTSVGKSTYAENIAEKIAYRGGRVLFCSIEMSPKQMMYRFAVRSGMLSRSALEFGISTDSDRAALERLIKTRSALPFTLYDAPMATASTIRGQVARLKLEVGQPDLVVIDYLQLMADISDKDGKEHLRIGKITKALKHLAREYNVPVILISQLNRNVEYRGGEPKLADLRESGRIEEDADLIIMLWEMDRPDALGNVTQGKIAKNRQGPQEKIPMVFMKESFTFAEPHGGLPNYRPTTDEGQSGLQVLEGGARQPITVEQ